MTSSIKLFVPILFLLTISIKAQEAIKWIPKESMFTMGMNLEKLKADLVGAQTTKREFYTSALSNFTHDEDSIQRKVLLRMIESPDSFGIKTSSGLGAFYQFKNNFMFGGCFLALADGNSIKNLVNEIQKTFTDTSVYYTSPIVNYFLSSSISIAWNNEKVFIGSGRVILKNENNWLEYDEEAYAGTLVDSAAAYPEAADPEVHYNKTVLDSVAVRSEEDYVETIDYNEDDYLKKIKEKQKLETDSTLTELQTTIENLFSNSFLSIETENNFLVYKKTRQHDVWFWADYAKLMENTSNLFTTAHWPGATLFDGIRSLYGDITCAFGFNLGQSDLNIILEMKQNGQLKELNKKIYDRKLNKDFFNYLPKQTIGFFSVAINIEEALNSIVDLYSPMLKNYPVYGENAATSLELIQLVLDEKALGNIIKGDVLCAFHTVDVIEKESIELIMDEEYNYTEKAIRKKDLTPKFVLMATVGDEKSFDLVMRGIQMTNIIYRTDGMYKVKMYESTKKDIGELYIMVHNGIAFFSNDSVLINDIIPNGGYKKSNQIEKRLQKLALQSATSLYFNPNLLIDAFEKSETLDSNQTVLLQAFKKAYTSIEIASNKPKKTKWKATISIKNAPDQTAIAHMLDLFEAYNLYNTLKRARWATDYEIAPEEEVIEAAPEEIMEEAK